MVDQMRTYTINKGMMDSWEKLFDTGIRPVHEALGVPVVATWVNADRTQFIWVRRFKDGDDVPAKEAEMERVGKARGLDIGFKWKLKYWQFMQNQTESLTQGPTTPAAMLKSLQIKE